MTEQEILEGNKLIAEFMGLIVLSKEEYEKHPNHARLNVNQYSIKEYQRYHTSWDWLMPVIQKTIALNLKLEIPQKRPDQSLVYAEIRIAWHEVVEFIKEYNSNK